MSKTSDRQIIDKGVVVNVYLETNLWNTLCDHALDADALAGSLGSRGINLGFSYHCVSEMAKTFRVRGPAETFVEGGLEAP
jgi:hypothetical protein